MCKPELRKIEAGTIAVFDLTEWHVPDGLLHAKLMFLKSDDRWYAVNETRSFEK